MPPVGQKRLLTVKSSPKRKRRLQRTRQSYEWRFGMWPTALMFGFILLIITTPAVFFFDFFAGSATRGFGVTPSQGVGGTGMFYLYAMSYFSSLLVIIPVCLIKRFGIATAVFLPYVVI